MTTEQFQGQPRTHEILLGEKKKEKKKEGSRRGLNVHSVPVVQACISKITWPGLSAAAFQVVERVGVGRDVSRGGRQCESGFPQEILCGKGGRSGLDVTP